MTFSLHQEGAVISSQITHIHNHQDTPLSPYTVANKNIGAIVVSTIKCVREC